MATRILYRQGDVLLELVDTIPAGAVEIPRTDRGVVLAEGEVTGHAHRIVSRHAKMYRTESDQGFVQVTAPRSKTSKTAALQHEEHSTVDLPPGSYRVTIHAEYSPGELPRQVAD